MLQQITILPALPIRKSDSHKGTFGRALLIGGSRGMSGAITLSGLACLRSSVGLCFLAVPENVLPIVAAAEPSYLTIPLPEEESGTIAVSANELLQEQMDQADVIAIGTGLGKSSQLTQLVENIYQTCSKPAIFDADALNALAKNELSQKRDTLSHHSGTRILTPHPGEFARLIDQHTASVQSDRLALATEFAKQHQVILVLKGHQTIITDGEHYAINTTGNSGMATGGTGDVLTGILAGLIASGINEKELSAKGMNAFDAAQLAVYLHGLSGDIAAKELGEHSMIASDLIRYLPQAFLKHAQNNSSQ